MGFRGVALADELEHEWAEAGTAAGRRAGRRGVHLGGTGAPGTSWAFSDTNFLILGQILQQVSGKPYPRLVKEQVLDQAGLSNTSFPTTSAIPTPVLHSYTNERGKYEEARFWSPSDFPDGGSVVTPLADLGRWTEALGTRVRSRSCRRSRRRWWWRAPSPRRPTSACRRRRPSSITSRRPSRPPTRLT